MSKTDRFQEIVEAKFSFLGRKDATRQVRAQLVHLSDALKDLRASLLMSDLAYQFAEDSDCQALFLEGLSRLELARLSIKRAAISLD